MQGMPPFPFLDHDVLAWMPDGVEGRAGAWTTPLERTEAPSGAFAVTAPALHPQHGAKALYRCFTRADHAALWTWVSAQLGRYGAFWCPSFQRDLDILDAGGVGPDFGRWIIRSCGYSAQFAADPTAKYLYAFRAGGSDAAALEVTSATDNGDGTETLEWADGVRAGPGLTGATDITIGNAQGACLLRLARLDADAIVQAWTTPSMVDLALSFATVPNEQP